MASSLLGIGPTTRRGGMSSGFGMTAGLEVTGGDAVSDMLKQWGMLTVYVTSFVSMKVARSVYVSSQRHVPYKEGDLFNSAFISSVENADRDANLSGLTIPIAENIEGTADYSKLIPEISTGFSRMGYFGGGIRAYTKYTVGYKADHAAVTHENPHNVEWNQDNKSPYPDRKTDHYLLNAYNAHRDKFSGAMKYGIEQTIAALAARVSPVKSPSALGAKPGAPRLRRPGA